MKKYLSLFFVLALGLFVNTQSARAEDGVKLSIDPEVKMETTSGNVQRVNADAQVNTTVQLKSGDNENEIKNLREKSKERMDVLRASLKTEKDSAKLQIKELRIKGRENALERFNKVIENITNVEVKVNAQIQKFKDRGVGVTSSVTLVAAAETDLNNAKIKITAATTLLSTSTNELTAESRTTLQGLVKEIQVSVNDAHKALVAAMKALRDSIKLKIQADAAAKASTTTTTTSGTTTSSQ